MLEKKVYKLTGKVQHYAWGGYDFIPQLLGIGNKKHEPFAEYWMGAHPSASSEILTPNGSLSLKEVTHDFPAATIGKKVQQRFGELPYLFKVLDVREMLSIQVHPTKEEAIKGFEAEEAAGISLKSPTRNYKDKNHKPEIMVALSEFWLLHGFLDRNLLTERLTSIPEYNALAPLFKDGNYKRLYQHVMEMPQPEVNRVLRSLVQRELQRRGAGELKKSDPGWWVSKLYDSGSPTGDIDRGVFSIYFFNIVGVNPGEAVFQAAGIPHAYLEGQNVELMANSDNVLRGGLTPKHVDVPELLKHTTFRGVEPDVMKGTQLGPGERNYPCPVDDFGISRIDLKKEAGYEGHATSLEIIIVIDGEGSIIGADSTVNLKRGEAAAILAGERYNISTTGKLCAYKAFVP